MGIENLKLRRRKISETSNNFLLASGSNTELFSIPFVPATSVEMAFVFKFSLCRHSSHSLIFHNFRPRTTLSGQTKHKTRKFILSTPSFRGAVLPVFSAHRV